MKKVKAAEIISEKYQFSQKMIQFKHNFKVILI